MDFFFLEDLHEVFSPRSTRYNPRRPAGPASHLFRIQVQYLEVSVCRSRQTAELFLPGRSFFRSAEDPWKAPSPTGVVFTTSTDSYPGSAEMPHASVVLPCSPTSGSPARDEISGARSSLGMLPTPPTPNPPEFQHCLLLELTPIARPFVSTDQFSQVLLQRESASVNKVGSLNKDQGWTGCRSKMTRSKPDTGMVPLEHDDRFQHKSYSGPLSSRQRKFHLPPVERNPLGICRLLVSHNEFGQVLPLAVYAKAYA